MAKDYAEEIFNAVSELDNEAFNQSDCTIILYFGTNDDGERYVDAEAVLGFPSHNLMQLATFINAVDLLEALKGLAKEF